MKEELWMEYLLSNFTEDENGCWIFNGPAKKTIRINGKTTSVRHLMYRYANGDSKHCVIHMSCGNENCVNPEHMRIGLPYCTRTRRKFWCDKHSQEYVRYSNEWRCMECEREKWQRNNERRKIRRKEQNERIRLARASG